MYNHKESEQKVRAYSEWQKCIYADCKCEFRVWWDFPAEFVKFEMRKNKKNVQQKRK